MMILPNKGQKLVENENAKSYIPDLLEKLSQVGIQLFLSSDQTERRRAIRKVVDHEILKFVFLNDPSWAVRLQALVRIKDQNFLFSVAKTKSFDVGLRKEAVDRIEDNDNLYTVATETSEINLIEHIVLRLKSKEKLKKLKHHLIKHKIFDGKKGDIILKIDAQIKSLNNSVSFMFD